MTREEIFRKHIGLAHSFANRYWFVKNVDVQSIAYIELWRAIPDYDPSKGAFTTFAYKRMWSGLMHENRHAQMIHIPAYVLEADRNAAIPVASMDALDKPEQYIGGACDPSSLDEMAVIQELPKPYREKGRWFLMNALDSYSVADIAKITGASVGEVTSAIRAVKRLLQRSAAFREIAKNYKRC